MQSGKPPIGMNFRIDDDIDARRTELCHHGIEVANAKVYHPALILIPEVFGISGERRKHGRTRLLGPRFLIVI